MLDLFDREPPRFVPASDDLTDFMNVLRPAIDRIVTSLFRAKFIIDPIIGAQLSRQTSVCSSAQKRHGRILEIALQQALRESGLYHVWSEAKFAVSRAADALVNSQSEQACSQSELPYGEANRFIQIDCGADSTDERSTGAYELKRANGLHDAGKIRSMRRDLACTQLLLKKFAGNCVASRASRQTPKSFFTTDSVRFRHHFR